jgi:hypothetical protein
MLTLLVAMAVAAAWILVARRVLLAWYLREVRRLEMPQAPDEAIVTYPLV